MHATRIIAIRHGETAWNVDTRIQGHLDIPLNDTGLWQARQLARALADEPVAAIYTSDLQRARNETCRTLHNEQRHGNHAAISCCSACDIHREVGCGRGRYVHDVAARQRKCDGIGRDRAVLHSLRSDHVGQHRIKIVAERLEVLRPMR